MLINLQTCFKEFPTGLKAFISIKAGNKKMAEKEKSKIFLIF
jgi:hypothetical protein